MKAHAIRGLADIATIERAGYPAFMAHEESVPQAVADARRLARHTPQFAPLNSRV